MATNRITYTLDFKANFKDVQGQLNTLRDSLNSIVGMKLNPVSGMTKDIEAAAGAASRLSGYMKKALDPSTGKLDLSRLAVQMKAGGDNAATLASNLMKAGSQGAQAFMQVSNAIVNAQKPMARLGTLTKSFATTLMNTMRWQLSTRVINFFTSSVSNALNYVKDMDKSLNDIRIVTGASRAEMDKFALSANKVAKQLSSTTNEVAKATLIYRQQGDSAAQALEKAQITIKAANAAGTSAQEMSEYLTGVWNSYQVGSHELELFVDKLAKVGAITATSMEEVSTAMTKVAATANAVGVEYDQLMSTIATVSSATRVSAETVGTAFKTIYARMGDLELKGSIDEDGITTTLGSVSSKLKQVGVDVLDANGNIRDMGNVVEDLGNRWKGMNRNQQTAIAEAVAGKRQYTQLFALFENWDKYKYTLKEAANAQGELNKQQHIYSDSVEAAQNRLKAAKESFYNEGIGADTYKEVLDTLTSIVETFDAITKSAGGLQPIFMGLGGYLMTKFAPQISQSLVKNVGGFLSTIPFLGKKVSQSFLNEWTTAMDQIGKTPMFNNPMDKASLDSMKEMILLKRTINQMESKMTDSQKATLGIMMEKLQTQHAQNQAVREEARELERTQKLNIANVSAESANTGKQAMKSQVVSKDQVSSILQADGGTMGQQVANNLFRGLQGTEVSLKTISERFSMLNSDAQALVTNSLAKYFYDGATASEPLANAVRNMLESTGNLVTRENEYLNSLKEEAQMRANILTSTTGILHLYDETNDKMIDGRDVLNSWKEKGEELLLQRQKYNQELDATTEKMSKAKQASEERWNSLSSSQNVKDLRANTDNVLKYTTDGSAEQKSIVSSFLDKSVKGTIDAETLKQMQPIIDALGDSTGKFQTKLRDAFNEAKTAFNIEEAANKYQAKIDGINQKLDQNNAQIEETTAGNRELIMSISGINDEYLNSEGYQKYLKELKEANAEIEKQIQSLKDQKKAAEDTMVKSSSDLKSKLKETTSSSSKMGKFSGKSFKKDGDVSGTKWAEQAKTAMSELANMEGPIDSSTESLQKLKEALTHLDSGDEVFKELKAALEQFENETDDAKTKVKQLDEAIDEANIKKGNIDKPEKPKPEEQDLNPQVDKSITNIANKVTSLSGSLMGLTMQASMFGNALKTATDPEATGFEKMMASITMITTAVSTLSGVMGLFNTAMELGAILSAKKTVADVAQTGAIGAQTTATNMQTTAQIAANATNPVGWIILAVTAIAALTAGIIAYAGGLSDAEADQERMEKATKKLEAAEKKLAEQTAELDSYEALNEKLQEAYETKENLAAVTNELNEALGIEFDLVNGGTSEFEKANAVLKERIRLKNQEIEATNKEKKEALMTQLNSVTGMSDDEDQHWYTFGLGTTENKISAKDTRSILKQFYDLDEATQKQVLAGEKVVNLKTSEHGEEQFDGDALNDILQKYDEILKDFHVYIEEINSPILGLTNIVDTMVKEEDFSENAIMEFVNKVEGYNDKLNDAINAGDVSKVESILKEIGNNLPEDMQDDWKKNTADVIDSTKRIESLIKNDKEDENNINSDSEVNSGLKVYKDISSEIRGLIKEFGEFGNLETESVDTFIKNLKETNRYSEDQLEAIEESLLKSNLTSGELGSVLGNITVDFVINSQDVKDALAEGDLDLVEKILYEGGVTNAKELAQQMSKTYAATSKVTKNMNNMAKDLKEISGTIGYNTFADELSNEAKELAKELNLSADEAHALTIQFGILENKELTKEEQISAMRRYAENAEDLSENIRQAYINASQLSNIDLSNLTVEQATIFNNAGVSYANGKTTFKGIEYSNMGDLSLAVGEELSNLYSQLNDYSVGMDGNTARERQQLIDDYNTEISNINQTFADAVADAEKTYAEAIQDAEKALSEALNDAEESLKEATESYQKAMKEFAKKEALEELQELIMKLDEAFQQFQTTLDGIDFEKELGNPLSFKEKINLYTQEMVVLRDQAIEAKEQFDQLSQIEPQDGDQAQELFDKISEVVEKYRSSILEIRELQSELSTAGVESMQEVIEEHSELIDKVTEAMNKLAELNNSQDKYYSETQEKALLATSIITTGLLKTKDKNRKNEETGQLTARKKENQEIIKESKKMEDTVRKYSKKANELGIKDRQQARAEEKADIEKEYAKAQEDYKKALNEAYSTYETALNDAKIAYDTALKDAEDARNRDLGNAKTAFDTAMTQLQTITQQRTEAMTEMIQKTIKEYERMLALVSKMDFDSVDVTGKNGNLNKLSFKQGKDDMVALDQMGNNEIASYKVVAINGNEATIVGLDSSGTKVLNAEKYSIDSLNPDLKVGSTFTKDDVYNGTAQLGKGSYSVKKVDLKNSNVVKNGKYYGYEAAPSENFDWKYSGEEMSLHGLDTEAQAKVKVQSQYGDIDESGKNSGKLKKAPETFIVDDIKSKELVPNPYQHYKMTITLRDPKSGAIYILEDENTGKVGTVIYSENSTVYTEPGNTLGYRRQMVDGNGGWDIKEGQHLNQSEVKTWIKTLNNYHGKNYDITKPNKFDYKKIETYGTGTDATKNELALFGEKDSDGDGKSEELLISPDGKVYLAGTNGPEMIQVKAGTKVFNDKETSKILKSKKDFSQLLTSGGQKAPIKTYGDGTSNFSSINENNNEIFADLNKATDKGIQDMNETFDKGFSEMLDTQSEYNQKQFKAQEETNSKLKTEQLENFEDRIDNLENYNKDTQKEVSSNNQKIESSVSGHLAKVNNNINLATSTMSGNVNSAATAMTEYINQMQFTLPGIDGEAFIESIGTILEQAREATGLPRKAQTSGTSPTGDGDADGEWLKKDNEVKTASEGVHEAYKSFIEAGMTDTGAKTLIANLQGESGFNLNPNALGDGGNSHGIAQWNNAAGRWQPVVNFLGDKAFTRAGQLEYLNYDLKNNYPNIWKMLTTKGFSPEEIMDALVRQYEKPENQNDAIKTRLNHLKQLDDSVFLYADDMNLWEIIEYVQARHRGESPFGNGDWIDPIIGGNKISSGGMFGVDRGDHKHGGVDIGAASNTPIYAPRSGTVIINAYQEAGAGNYIRLDHGDGYQTTFMHMIKPSELKVGSSVSQGDIIGYVGNTGRSYGAHLHYEVSLNGKRVDPREFLQAYAKGGITSNERALVGEYGREIILYPDGTAGLLGENGIEYADLPAGARIIPSQETEKILNNPKDYRENINPILGFAQGTAKEYLTLTDIPWDILKKVLTYIHSQGGEYAFEVDPSTLTEFKNTADFSKKVTAFKRNKVGETANLNDLIDFVENVFAEAATPGSEESLEKATDATKEAIKVQQTLTKAIDRACIEITDPLTTLYTAMKDLGFVFSDTSQWTDALKDALLQYSEHSSNKREIQNMLKALKEGEVPTNRFLEMTATMLKLDSEALVSTAKERKKGLAQKADGSYYLFDKGENPLVQKDSIDKELSYLDMKGVLSNLDAAADLESAYESKRMAASLNQNPNSQLYRLKTDKGYKYYITDDIVTLDWYSGGVDTSKLEQMNKEYLFENLKAQNFQYMDANDATWEYNSKRQAAYYDKDQIQGYNMETGQIDPNKDKYVLVQVDSLKEDNKWGIDNYSLMKANYNDEQMKAIFGTNAVRLSDAEKRSALLNFDTQKLWNNTMTWTAKQFIWDNTIKDEATGQFKAKPGTVFYVKEDPNNLANSQVYAVDKDHPLASYGITPEQEKNEFKILDSQSVDELASGLLVSDVRLKEMLDYYLNPQLAPGNNQAEANDPLAKYRDFLTLEEGGIISHNKASFERIQEHWDSEWIREQNKKNYKENIEFYKKYPLMTEEQQMEQLYERQRKTNSAEMARYSRMLDETLAIYNDYMDKISSGEITEADVEYLSALEETIQTASDEIDKISQNMIDATEKQKTWADNQSAFTIMRNDAFNLWTESNSKVNLALEDLQKTIQDFPEDIDRFYEKFNVLKTSVASEMSEWLSAYQTYVNKLIEGINDDVTRLTALKTVQEQFNAELNKYRDVQHQINKQLTESKMNAMWLDEKTKQNIFNEKSYLAIAEKIAEVREEARDDYHDYLYDINHLGDDELYRANILTEEYKERAAIREKELAILQEEINLQAKQNVLNEALMERNVRVFSGGRWRQIANIQNVTKAQQDLDETKYKIETKQIELDQQNDLNTDYNQPLRENNEEIGRLNELLTQAQEYVTENTDALNGVKKVTSESIDSFKKKVDAQMKHMGALEDEIARYNVNSKEEFTRNSVLGLASEALAAWARGDMDAVADNKIQMEAYGASELARFFDTANPDTSYDKALEAVNAWRNYRNLPEFDLPSYAATTAASRSEADNMTLINDALTGLFKLKVMAEKTSDTDTFNRANLLATNIREYLKVLKYSGDDYSGMTADAMKQDILSKGKYSLGNGTIEDVFSTIVKGMFSNTDTNLFGQKSVSLISGDNRGIFSDAFSQKIGLDYIHNVGTSARSEVSTSLALRSLKGESSNKQNTIAKLFTDLYALKNHFDENGYKSGYSDLFSSDVSEMSEQIRQMIGVILFGDASKGLSIGADMNAEEFLATFGDFINPEKKKLTSKDRDSVLDIGEEVVRDIRSDIPQDTSDIEFYAWRSLYRAKHGWGAIAGKDGVTEEDLQPFVDKADYAREILLSTGKYTEEQLSGMKIEEVEEKLKNDYKLTDAQITSLQETAIDTIQNELVKTVEDYSNMMTTAKETLEQIQAVFAASSSVAAQDFATVIESILEKLQARMDALDRKEQELNSRSTTVIVPQSNARGTRNAHAGLSWVNEQGIEMLATNEGQLIELNPHEKIFNNDQLNFLYDLSKQKIGGMKQAVSSITSNNNNSISIADLNISLDNVTDAQSFIDELRGLTSYIRNTKTIYGNSR